MIIEFCNNEVGCICSLPLFNAHGLSECIPHSIFPFQVVLFHALVVISFTSFTNAPSTHLGQYLVDFPTNQVVMFVCLIPKTEYDVFETIQCVFTVGKLEGLVFQVLH